MFSRKILENFGMPSVVRGLAFLDSPSVFRWKGAANGELAFGRTCVRSAALSLNFKGLVRAPGFLSVALDVPREFTIDESRIIVIVGSRLRLILNGI